MLRHVIVGFLLAALAYVCCVPLPVLHRAKRWEEFPNVTFTFDCSDRAVGFYADVEHHCQIFHMCDEDGRRIPYICANDTSFNQQYRICDWDYNFECQETPQWYYLNELTYVTDPPQPKLRSSNRRDQLFV
ncbi:U-scoloptoxin(01)-Er1a [Anabrus simplex]|uniref:U-scoloptoxin(01)-Er1a n=1 Tax=Anabrus simplex TaxID=316456 RepID=UPI0034DD35DB